MEDCNRGQRLALGCGRDHNLSLDGRVLQKGPDLGGADGRGMAGAVILNVVTHPAPVRFLRSAAVALHAHRVAYEVHQPGLCPVAICCGLLLLALILPVCAKLLKSCQTTGTIIQNLTGIVLELHGKSRSLEGASVSAYANILPARIFNIHAFQIITVRCLWELYDRSCKPI